MLAETCREMGLGRQGDGVAGVQYRRDAAGIIISMLGEL